MKFYTTQYCLKDPFDFNKKMTFNSYIYAVNYGMACQLAAIRNIGELVLGVLQVTEDDPCPLPSLFYRSRRMIDCLHTLSFYTWIGSSAKVVNATDELSDIGLVHEIIHEMNHPAFYGFRQEIYNKLQYFESLIPGLKTYIPTFQELSN